MPLNSQRHKTNLIIYLLAELALLIAAKICESLSLSCEGSVKFAAVICNAAFALFYFLKFGIRSADAESATSERASRPEDLIAYALFLTVIADFFLTLISKESVYGVGIATFCVVQLIYMKYLKPTPAIIAAMAALFAASLFALYKAGMLEAASVLGTLDLVLILGNTISAWFSNKSEPSLLFRLGIALFCACDMSIFLSLALSGKPSTAFSWMVWVFYAPSQVLITLAYVSAALDRPDN